MWSSVGVFVQASVVFIHTGTLRPKTGNMSSKWSSAKIASVGTGTGSTETIHSEKTGLD